MIAALSASILALVLVATVPLRTDDLAPQPRRTADYAAAVTSISRRDSWEQRFVVPEGRSTLLAHGHRTATAALLLHGFTNSPLQFDSLGRLLFEAGANVYIPRLPRHAEVNGGAATLAGLTAEELRAAADSAMDLAGALGDTVVVIGLSLGGTMAAWIAQFRPDAFRVVVIAPVLALARIPTVFQSAFAKLAVRAPGLTHSAAAVPSEHDRELGWSTSAIGQILRLGIAVERVADITPPAAREIAIMVNANDRTIASAPVLALARTWQQHGARVRIVQLPKALGLPHDVIDPRQPIRRLDVVYPTTIALALGGWP